MSSTKLIKRGHAAVLGDDWVGDHRGLAKWTLAGTWCNINPDEQSIRPVIVFPKAAALSSDSTHATLDGPIPCRQAQSIGQS